MKFDLLSAKTCSFFCRFVKCLMQERAQEFEKGGGGGGRNLKPSVFRPKSSEEQKKVNTFADVQFSDSKSNKEQKKDHHALRLSFIRVSPLHH